MVKVDNQMLVQYGHFLAASAWAGLGNHPQTMYHLNRAVEANFDAVHEMERSPHLMILHDSPEWKQIIQRIEEQAHIKKKAT